MQMIHNAKTKGEIDSKVDSLALCLLLQSLNSAVNKYMIGKFGGISYEYNQEDINNFVDSLLDIIFSGFRIKLIKIWRLKETYNEKEMDFIFGMLFAAATVVFIVLF